MSKHCQLLWEQELETQDLKTVAGKATCLFGLQQKHRTHASGENSLIHRSWLRRNYSLLNSSYFANTKYSQWIKKSQRLLPCMELNSKCKGYIHLRENFSQLKRFGKISLIFVSSDIRYRMSILCVLDTLNIRVSLIPVEEAVLHLLIYLFTIHTYHLLNLRFITQ